ncbi:hypothetical protein IEQ34_018123 [Dendrobium chrysotoxum]|uniref:Translation initiation factor beta propellor-like domain-containing protein n=1 Tax=Dendrobium chrysotoxum TaxID=161865 RepID=A0AAV7GDQ2_DENCH|nr:hypothetical protein IEQ34_018123 [Dendrobium chrysotoxum]
MDRAPTLEILAREPEGFSIWNGPPFNNGQPKVKLERVSCTAANYCGSGSRLMVMESSSSICVYDCNTSTKIKSFDIPAVSASTLSPCGTFIQTFQKSTTPQEKNVVLWLIENGAAVYQHFQKNMTKTTWPAIQFSSDESIACRMVTNEIQFLDGKDFTKGIIYRLRVPGVMAIELSKTPGSHIAAFVAESKGVPASVQIFSCKQDAQAQPIARRSFFRCSSIQLHWNHGSTGLLAVAQSDVDKTNQSYYGESKLNYLTTDGSHEGLVPLSMFSFLFCCHRFPSFFFMYEVRIIDLWSICQGRRVPFMMFNGHPRVWNLPLSMDLFLPEQQYLTTNAVHCLSWVQALTIQSDGIRKGNVSLSGKLSFICLAGFGNLPGDMAFWDYSEKRLIGTTKAECSVSSEWSPDGLYFMTATTAPRLQIDNGIKIFHYNGSLYFKKMFNKLYQADWKPEAPEKFGDIMDLVKSVSIIKIDETKTQANTSQAAAKVSMNTSQAATKVSTNIMQKPVAYRPPHAKNAAAVKAELFGGISSSEEINKNAMRNKKRREKQREKKAAEASAAASDDN